ncbi:MAG TPA: DUF2252 family protein, partial [Acetobacteraceae bacterium]|nr:DUF2252 family protein [Acetobacteraceae bacterium]
MAKSEKTEGKDNDKHPSKATKGGKDTTATRPSAKIILMTQSRGQAAGEQTNATAPSDRRAQGKALRDVVPRTALGGWKAPKDRRDPIDLLAESNKGRFLDLVPIRFGRMMQSPFAFYRGSAAIMAADLATTPRSELRVQACGDAHLLNFGAFATPERNVVFDINDLDETL